MSEARPGAQEMLPVLQEGEEGGQVPAGLRAGQRGAGLRHLCRQRQQTAAGRARRHAGCLRRTEVAL